MLSQDIRLSNLHATARAIWTLAAVLFACHAIVLLVVAVYSGDRQWDIWATFTRVLQLGWRRPDAYFALLAGLLIVEIVCLGWRQSSVLHLLKPSRSARTDLVVAGVHVLGWSPLLTIAFTGGTMWFFEDLLVPLRALRWIEGITPIWLQAGVVFLAADFLDYWYHRLMHRIEFLWEAHKYHHSATEFTILTGNRIHALEDAFRHVFAAVPLAILGTPAVTYVMLRYAVLAVDMLQHSMLPWTYGWVGRWVFFSPVGHRIHHSALPEHWDRNLGNILVIWDRLFGTYYAGERVNDRVDVTNNLYNQRGIVAEYFLCGVLFVRSLARSVSTGAWRLTPDRGAHLRTLDGPADGAQ
jgi:sterol desaturase/sphingolipid hydroxylase (fatty acid hydroxylase superfamily)